MLINTILFFLQTILPILVLITCLIFTVKPENRTWLYWGGITGVLMLIILTIFNNHFNNSFIEMGIELYFAVGYLLSYICIIALLILRFSSSYILPQKFLILAALACCIVLNMTSFVWYLSDYLYSSQPLAPLFIGIVLAVGIAISSGILLFFIFGGLPEYFMTKIPSLILLFFASGQLMQAITILSQVDLWPVSNMFINVDGLLSDNTKLDELLMNVFGFRTRMTQIDFFIYISSLILPLILMKRSQHES